MSINRYNKARVKNEMRKDYELTSSSSTVLDRLLFFLVYYPLSDPWICKIGSWIKKTITPPFFGRQNTVITLSVIFFYFIGLRLWIYTLSTYRIPVGLNLVFPSFYNCFNMVRKLRSESIKYWSVDMKMLNGYYSHTDTQVGIRKD